LCVKVKGQGNKVDISSSFTVAEQASLDTVSSSHLSQLSGGNTASTVIMGVQGYTNILSVSNVVAERLDQIGINVGCCQLDCGREVEDNLVTGLGIGSPGSLDGLANSHSVVGVGIGEALGREFELPVSSGGLRVVLGQRSDQLGALDSKLQGLLLRVTENNLTEASACSKVDVNNGVLGTADRLDGSADEVRSAGRQDL
jgi:hypothetical protein